MNVALDVFIGLTLVFLLYSLLATILMEFIAHALHMRPRLLIKALQRMLEDNPPEIFGYKKRWTRIDSSN
jgi:energy-converting hydrogenase Eha subunit E